MAEVRLSPDGHVAAIYRRWAKQWAATDGQMRTDAQVTDWTVMVSADEARRQRQREAFDRLRALEDDDDWSPDEVEAAAKRIAAVGAHKYTKITPDEVWDLVYSDSVRDDYRAMARAALGVAPATDTADWAKWPDHEESIRRGVADAGRTRPRPDITADVDLEKD